MKKIIVLIVLFMFALGTVCFAEEVLSESSSGDYIQTLLTAKTVEEGRSYSIIKAKVKEEYTKSGNYTVSTWLLKTSTKQVILTMTESYDNKGILKNSATWEDEIKVNPNITQKIIRYVENKEG